MSSGSALTNMRNLIAEYNYMDMTGMQDLLKKDIIDVAKKMFKQIQARDFDGFTQIFSILEQELKLYEANMLKDEYYHHEDIDSDNEE